MDRNRTSPFLFRNEWPVVMIRARGEESIRLFTDKRSKTFFSILSMGIHVRIFLNAKISFETKLASRQLQNQMF